MNQNSQNINYIVLSDLHFGEKNSLFTPYNQEEESIDETGITNTAKELVKLIHNLVLQNQSGTLPTLILNGDILGLAFASYQYCMPIFGKFLRELLLVNGICPFQKIVYLPGNHDHHLWEFSREQEYSKQIEQHFLGQPFPKPFHTLDGKIESSIPSSFMDGLMNSFFSVQELKGIPKIELVYPNLILHQENRTPVFIHHGHFAEDIYFLMSVANRRLDQSEGFPDSVEVLEKENFAWIEFGWSLLGRSGKTGTDLEEIMKILRNPDVSKDERMDLADRLSMAADIPYVPEFMEKFLARTIISKLSGESQGERYRGKDVCSSPTILSLMEYIATSCKNQIQNICGTVPKEMNVIWGHTHKPFDKTFYHQKMQCHMNMYNTGGWTIDRAKTDAQHGARMALISDQHDVAMVHLFQNTNEVLAPKVSPALHPDASMFVSEIQERVAKYTNQEQYIAELRDDIATKRSLLA